MNRPTYTLAVPLSRTRRTVRRRWHTPCVRLALPRCRNGSESSAVQRTMPARHGCVIAERVGDALIVLVPQWVPSVFPFHRCRKHVFRMRCPILSQSIRHSGCRHAPFLKGRGRSRPGRSNVTVHGKSPYRSAWTDSGSFRRVSTYSWNVAQSNMPRSRQYRDSASLPSRRA